MTLFPNQPNKSNQPNQSNQPKRCILIVDDEMHILQVLSIKLRNAGYDVLLAEDGEEALELVFKELPDLIITDFQMPFMTGLELCRALKADERSTDIPVIMLTARGYTMENVDLDAVNIRHVVHKPFSPRAILEMVKILLAPDSASGDTPRTTEAA